MLLFIVVVSKFLQRSLLVLKVAQYGFLAARRMGTKNGASFKGNKYQNKHGGLTRARNFCQINTKLT